MVEKLIGNNDKSTKEEAKELKSILVNKNYDNFENNANLIDNNLAVQGRKKYESKQHIQMADQTPARNTPKQVNMLEVLQDSKTDSQKIAQVENTPDAQPKNVVEGIKLDKLKGRYNQPVKISKEDIMMIEESDEEQLFRTNALDDEENKREFEEELAEQNEEDTETKKPKELAGWGDWVGHGIAPKKQEQKPAETSKKLSLNRKRTNVIVNESLPKNFRKYMVPDLPHEYKNKDQYNFEVGLALGSEWNGLKNSKSFCKSKVVNNAGEVITPLDPKHLPKAKFL